MFHIILIYETVAWAQSMVILVVQTSGTCVSLNDQPITSSIVYNCHVLRRGAHIYWTKVLHVHEVFHHHIHVCFYFWVLLQVGDIWQRGNFFLIFLWKVLLRKSFHERFNFIHKIFIFSIEIKPWWFYGPSTDSSKICMGWYLSGSKSIRFRLFSLKFDSEPFAFGFAWLLILIGLRNDLHFSIG